MGSAAPDRPQRKSRRLAAKPLDLSASGRRGLLIIGLYRIASAAVLLGVGTLFDPRWAAHTASTIFNAAAALYLCYGFAGFWWIWRYPRALPLPLVPSLLLGGDLLFIATLTLASGGQSGPLPILIFPQLAASGWLLRTRTAFFHAAVAALVLLGLYGWGILQGWASGVQAYQAGLFGLAYFATIAILVAVGGYARASEALAEQRGIDLANLDEVNRLIIQDMQDGVLVIDHAGIVARYNAQATRLLNAFGLLREGMPLTDLSPAIEASWRLWAEDGNDPAALLEADGTETPLRIRFVRIGSEQFGGTLVYLEDAGRAQHAARQIKLAAMGRLTASIAHEVRNPLSAINHAAQLLEEDTAGAPESQRLLGMIRNNAKRIDRIVGEVLQLARRDRQEVEAIVLSPFLRSLLDEIARAEKIPAECVVVDVAEGFDVQFDRGQLGQIIWNLVRNAWQHCSRVRGSIRIAVRPGHSSDWLLLELSDDGPGIAPELRSHLFEPFFTTRHGGTGLGLYVARELADANGASLDLLPNGPGAHLRLTMRRPAREPGSGLSQ